MAAAVMGDAPVAVGGEIEHLIFPGIRTQRPAMTKDHGLPFAPVLIINLRAVFGRNRCHGVLSFLVLLLGSSEVFVVVTVATVLAGSVAAAIMAALVARLSRRGRPAMRSSPLLTVPVASSSLLIQPIRVARVLAGTRPSLSSPPPIT